jgi:glycosyltransferase involved in cell wall biosynthesis
VSLKERGIYTDLIRKFVLEGHDIFIATSSERRYKKNTIIIKDDIGTLLKIRTLNFQKTSILEKTISTLLIDYQFLFAIKRHFSEISFDLILYTTPPITFIKTLNFLKQKNSAKTYLLLKDIFPQNAVDLGMIKHGSLIYRFFRKKEIELYALSDYIGCMSNANIEYVRKHNCEVRSERIELNPNSIEPISIFIDEQQKLTIRKKYKIPTDAIVFIFGGNLGKPQGLDFLIRVLNSQINNDKIFFVIVGSGTEYSKMKLWLDKKKLRNTLLFSEMHLNEYNTLAQSCDVGMIFLDRRFTIPNFPSRILSYLENKLPIIAATDTCTDIGEIMIKNNFGLWSQSGDLPSFNQHIQYIVQSTELRKKMGQNGYYYMLKNYNVTNSYNSIISHFINV